jgi:hypothetical protein
MIGRLKGSSTVRNHRSKPRRKVLTLVVVASFTFGSSLRNTHTTSTAATAATTSNTSPYFVVTAMVIRPGPPTGKNHQESHPPCQTVNGRDHDPRFPYLDTTIADILHQRETKKETTQVDQKGTSSPSPPHWIVVQVDTKSRKLSLRRIHSVALVNDDFGSTLVGVSLTDLVDLTRVCEDFVFGTTVDDKICWSPPIQGLIHLAGAGRTNRGSLASNDDETIETPTQQRQLSPPDSRHDDNDEGDAKITVATLLALNGLESAIRDSLGHVTGRAPLLRTMIAQMAAVDDAPTTKTTETIPLPTPATVLDVHNPPSRRQLVAAILQRLLLPHPAGLNLRNVLWHGFVGGALPRSWLALVVVLTTILQQNDADDAPTTRRSNFNGNHTNGITPSQNVEVFSFRSSQNPSLRYLVTHSDSMLDRIQQFRSGAPHDKNHPHLYHSSFQHIKAWLPPSHSGLWDLALDWIHKGLQPACTIAILTILLENALRLDWCRLNQRPEDSWARPGAFFVTLDGHGQRKVHDLLLHPHVSSTNTNTTTTAAAATTTTANTPTATPAPCICLLSETDNAPDATNQPTSGQDSHQHQQQVQLSKQNQLIFYLGGSTVALLTDLFASSSGGPNIRATISHGLWDSILEQELVGRPLSRHSTTTTSTVTSMIPNQSDSSEAIWDMVRVLLVAMEMVAKRQKKDNSLVKCHHYRPVFSVTATTRQSLHQARKVLLELLTLQATSSHFLFLKYAQLEFGEINNGRETCLSNLLAMPPDFLPSVPTTQTRRLWCFLGGQDSDDEDAAGAMSEWSAEQVFAEHETNQQLASCSGAARSLLQDVASATLSHLNVLTTALSELSQDTRAHDVRSTENRKPSSRRRQLLRVVHASELAFDIYSFAALVSVLSIEQELRPLGATDGIPSKVVLLKAVERSRMVVSTVDKFLHDNPDRAIKAVREYVKGKAIKEVAAKASQIS